MAVSGDFDALERDRQVRLQSGMRPQPLRGLLLSGFLGVERHSRVGILIRQKLFTVYLSLFVMLANKIITPLGSIWEPLVFSSCSYHCRLTCS